MKANCVDRLFSLETDSSTVVAHVLIDSGMGLPILDEVAVVLFFVILNGRMTDSLDSTPVLVKIVVQCPSHLPPVLVPGTLR